MGSTIRLILAAGLLLGVVLLAKVQAQRSESLATIAAKAEPVDWTPLFPQAPGRDYVTSLCSQCHTTGILVLQRRSPKMWRDFLLGMNAARAMGGELCACIGGPLDKDEIALITDYLSGAFPRDNPIDQLPLNVNTASSAALGRLPGLSQEDVRRLLTYRGVKKFVKKDEIERVLGWKAYRPISNFIDVKDSLFRADGLLPM